MRFDTGYRAHTEEMVGGADTIDNKGGTMATKKKKHGNLIITKMKRNLRLPAFRPSGKPDPKRALRMLWLDDEVLPDSNYVECVWIWPRDDQAQSQSAALPHTHDHDEVLGFFGTNPDDVYDLGGEITIFLEDEEHVITKSCLIFIPKHMKHTPLYVRKVTRPIFHFASSPAKIYDGRLA